MNGATDIKLTVTMDASQAKAEAERLHRELARRYRPATAEDAWNKAWDNSTGMPPNPFNQNLPYEHARHSGIWWANQRGIKGLGNPEYRHQFFSEREAKYMGLQFAKGAHQELIKAGKGFAASFIPYLVGEGVQQWAGWSSHVGRNNRTKEMVGNTAGGALGGMAAGAAAGAGIGAWAGGIGAVPGAIIGGAIGLFGGGGIAASNTAMSHRNTDEQNWMSVRQDNRSRAMGRNYGIRDWAMQAQIGMSPSREGKLSLLSSQLNDINKTGYYSIKNLEKLRYAMINGTEHGGIKYAKGDWNTEKGQKIDSILQALYSRRESLTMQYVQTKYTQPSARPINAVTDSYSQRGLRVGAQVNVQKTNTIIVDKMKTIIGLLESIRKTGAKSDPTQAQF